MAEDFGETIFMCHLVNLVCRCHINGRVQCLVGIYADDIRRWADHGVVGWLGIRISDKDKDR